MTVLTFPPDYSSAHGDLLYVVSDAHAADSVTYPNYKYVLDLYDAAGTTLLQRLYAVPRPPDKVGIFNIGPVVRSYFAIQFNPGSGIYCQNLEAGEFSQSFYVKLGEEYGFDLYLNLLTLSRLDTYNYYTGRVFGPTYQAPTMNLLDYESLPATSGPKERFISGNDEWHFLPFFNHTGADLEITITAYDAAGGVAGEEDFFYGGEVGMNILNLSIPLIQALPQPPLQGDTQRYRVMFNGDTAGAFYFNIKEECIHTDYKLHSWNQLGGFETFRFPKVSRKTHQIERKTFTQPSYRIAETTGAVSYANAGNVLHDQRTQYAGSYKEALKVTSDLLTDAEYQWLRELVVSPIVYLDDNSGYLIPVTIGASNYEEKKYDNDKMTSLSPDLDFGQTHNVQFR